MRVAFLSFAFGEYSVRLASALAADADVGLWLTDHQAEPHLDRLDPRVAFRPFRKPRMRQPFRQVAAMAGLYRQIRRFRPDVLHIQQGYLWFNPLLRFLRRIPVVVTVHDPTPHLGDRLGRKTPQVIADMAYREASAIIVHNEQMKLEMIGRGIAAERVHVVPTVIRGNAEASVGGGDAGNVVLFFGRIWPYKGLEYLIGAEPLISAEVPDARIVIAGKGEDFERYRKLMVHPERFEVLNEFIPFEETAGLFERASVVALPYVDATQSGVIATAYNFGKPVVATTVGGLPSMVDDGETGFLVAPRDIEALAAAITRLLKDPELRARLGAQAKRKAETEFAAEAVAAKTLAVYGRLDGN